jgi:hypothetical protein
VGTLYYQQNTGVGLGWGSAVQVQQLVAPDAFAQFYPVTISPTTFGLFTAQIDPTNFFSAIGNLKYQSIANSFLTTGAAPPPPVVPGSIRITLRGVKLRPICEPEDGGPVPEISKVPRAL